MATTDDRIVLNEITNSKSGLSAILDKVRAPASAAHLDPERRRRCERPLTRLMLLLPALPQGSQSVAYPANVRVTRQAAARQRALQQQQQQQQPDGADLMAVDAGSLVEPMDARDTQQCHHYVKDIFTYLRELELEHRVSPHFMQVAVTALWPQRRAAAPPNLPLRARS